MNIVMFENAYPSTILGDPGGLLFFSSASMTAILALVSSSPTIHAVYQRLPMPDVPGKVFKE